MLESLNILSQMFQKQFFIVDIPPERIDPREILKIKIFALFDTYYSRFQEIFHLRFLNLRFLFQIRISKSECEES